MSVYDFQASKMYTQTVDGEVAVTATLYTVWGPYFISFFMT